MKKGLKIYVAGHNGMVGSAVWRALEKAGYTNLIGKTSTQLDLRDQKAVQAFIAKEKPQAIIDAAAKVGGILANSQDQYGFLLQNLQIQNNLIQAAHEHEVAKFIFLGSSCIFPKLAPQFLKEDYLLTGPLEPTDESHALAKIAGVKPKTSLNIWGTGTPMREFLHVDDLAKVVVFVMEKLITRTFIQLKFTTSYIY